MTAVTGNILVVDDQATNRMKMSLAVKALGHRAEAASDGGAALTRLRQGNFDLLLLDIVMPGMSGFEVLEAMKSDQRLRDIPVIVISALEEMDSIVTAIEKGAEDFLPKAFDPVLLKARVTACLEKKRLRDLELAYLEQVEVLTRAAAVLEAGNFNPARLPVQTIAARPDALGKLARVFLKMAQEVYEREQVLRRRVATLRGGFMLIGVGLLWGIVAPLSKLASFGDAHAMGLAFWVNLLGGFGCLGIAVARGRLPRLTRASIQYFLLYGLLAGVAAQVLLFLAAEHLQASIVSMVMVAEGFMVYAFTSAVRIEPASFRRIAGLAVGLLGVLMILISGESLSGVGNWLWVLVALGVPLCYALEDILIAARRPEGIDTIASVGLMMGFAALMMLPLVVAFDNIAIVRVEGDLTGLLLVGLIGAATAGGTALLILLVTTTGAVFASQNAYSITFFGIGWSVLLLGEQISGWAWAALIVMIGGLVLVGPKNEAEQAIPPELLAGMTGKPRSAKPAREVA